MSSRKVRVLEEAPKPEPIPIATVAPVTPAITAITGAIIPRKGCFGYGRETEEERYEAVLQSTAVEEQFKNSIRRRYIQLLSEFSRRAYRYSLLYHIGHLIITVGSLVVPALLSVQYTTTLAAYQTNIYWLTWTLSLLVTTFNGVLVLFKVDKKYHSFHTTLERLRSEGWQYLELTGRYAGHLLHNGEEASHKNQYRFFCHYVEKIKLAQVEDEYFKYEDSNNPLTHAPSTAKQGTKDPSIVLPSINEELASFQPPQTVKEVMKGLITTDSPTNEIIIPVK